jgi:hypothetical protein
VPISAYQVCSTRLLVRKFSESCRRMAESITEVAPFLFSVSMLLYEVVARAQRVLLPLTCISNDVNIYFEVLILYQRSIIFSFFFVFLNRAAVLLPAEVFHPAPFRSFAIAIPQLVDLNSLNDPLLEVVPLKNRQQQLLQSRLLPCKLLRNNLSLCHQQQTITMLAELFDPIDLVWCVQGRWIW